MNGTGATGGGTTSDAGGTFSIARTDYAETPSGTAAGLASSTLTRDSATYSNGSCGAYSGFPATIVGIPDQTLGAGCYVYVLTGTDNVGNAVSLTTVVRVHGAATVIDLTGSTADLASGGAARMLTATIRDAAGNTVTTGASSILDIAFSDTAGAGTLSGLGTATAVAGVATVNVTGVLAGATTTTADETPSSGITAGTLGFTVVHGAATQIDLTGSTADLASGAAARTLTATAQGRRGQHRSRPGRARRSTSPSPIRPAPARSAGLAPRPPSRGVATVNVTGVLAGATTTTADETPSAGLTLDTLGASTSCTAPPPRST